jgi:hypothetical protein
LVDPSADQRADHGADDRDPEPVVARAEDDQLVSEEGEFIDAFSGSLSSPLSKLGSPKLVAWSLPVSWHASTSGYLYFRNLRKTQR